MRNRRIKLLFGIIIFFTLKSVNVIGSKKYPCIYISYYKGLAETLVPTKCGDIFKIPRLDFKVDTTITDTFIVNEIIKQAKNEIAKTKHSASGCDTRMDCKILQSKTDSIEICIGQINCVVINGEQADPNKKLLYLIRKNSGYYNYFNRHELRLLFDEIKIYGIPKDHKYGTVKML